ncbi:methylated-DNA-[protein]-cysteine S-methyltransferase [Pseudogymnoascus sp. 23342-1-I1]|nr:methylated-DNA-[protein]-cysteine S-methyltransferase [Pseudogymnoascus sp. 23342-1-I1]
MAAKVTPYQERVYALLVQIPSGRITSYKSLSDALDSSPRAIGGALRNNPFAPEVVSFPPSTIGVQTLIVFPCHRCIASTGFVGGFMGDWNKAPSGINQEKKIELLKGEGVEFDEKGMLMDKGRWWDEFKV